MLICNVLHIQVEVMQCVLSIHKTAIYMLFLHKYDHYAHTNTNKYML